MSRSLLIVTIIISISSSSSSSSSSFFPSLFDGGSSELSFIVEYVHRNSSQTPYERVRASLDRPRYQLLSGSNADEDKIVSRVYPDSVEYLMSISIGTPPFKIFAIADTGSDLVWTQCNPCRDCYKLNSLMFDPSGSKTYKEVSCGVFRSCPTSDFDCNSDHKCSYSYNYSDRSSIDGVASTDTVTFDTSSGKKVAIRNIIIGCTHQTEGSFRGAGLIGLSGGPLSLISQLGNRIHNKFSYCLVPIYDTKSSSSFTFGSSAKTVRDAVKVPIVQSSVHYSLNLESIKVGSTTVPMVRVGGGNIIIDSGTTLTFLPKAVVDGLASAISKLVNRPTVTLSADVDPHGVFGLCYNVADVGGPKWRHLPDVNLDFGNNAVLVLPPRNVFFKVSESVTCFAMVSMEGRRNTIGNIAQQDFLVEYDVGNKELSFAPMDCTKY